MWTDEETKIFLSLIHEKNITAILDGKQQQNATIYFYCLLTYVLM